MKLALNSRRAAGPRATRNTPWILFLSALFLSAPATGSAATAQGLPPAPARKPGAPPTDWLISPAPFRAGVYQGANEREIVLENGLIRRVFRLAPNAATVSLDNLMTGASVLRAVKPEAWLTVNGREQTVGGLEGQPERAYLLPEWIDRMTNAPTAFQYAGFDVGAPDPRLEWKHRWPASSTNWPPTGAALTLHFTAPTGSGLESLHVAVHHELYDGLPVLAKWLTLENRSTQSIVLDRWTTEILAVVEAESAVDSRETKDWRLPNLDLLSDYSFGGMDSVTANRTTVWLPDEAYTSQVHYLRQTPALLVSRPPVGPGARIGPGERLTGFRSYLVVHDTDQRERRGLGLRQLHRILSPWATENPILMHVRSAERKLFRQAVDQCAEVGFEMIIYTFGSGLNLESEDPDYLARVKEDVDYAHRKGLAVGGYSLLGSCGVGPEVDVINPKTGRTGGAIFGTSPCLATEWGTNYFRKIKTFIERTGLDLLEHDGSYPGDVCASTRHPGHRGLEDSQWTQWRMITDFYAWCRARGVSLNVPDYYFLAGSSKVAMGYREDNWSLPRERQLILGRQNIFDGTWTKTPSMGWMFVPLTEYHGGGAAATLEPLSEHLKDYEAHLVNNFGSGVQACFRGPRLYDTEPTRDLVRRWVSWFKQHRAILESDVIHVRRADGRDIDCLLHVNPALPEKGLAVVWNPLPQPVTRTFSLPLYYTGLRETALIREQNRPPRRHPLSRDYLVEVTVEMPPKGFTWLVVE